MTSVAVLGAARLGGYSAALTRGASLFDCPHRDALVRRAWVAGWLAAQVSGLARGTKGLPAVTRETRSHARWRALELDVLRVARGFEARVPSAVLAALLGRTAEAIRIESTRLGITTKRRRAA